MREIVLGTAGHVDHGKTSLVRALTGIDTDRLKEEKERGITIELGFAFLDLPCGHRLGIVDVPGHERFVKNMVAGAAGIDLVAFVIAADEGVMPQTREHFEICRLLGVKRGLVILTKKDMVEPDWLDMVEEEVREFLVGSFLEEAPIVAVSSTTGEGIEEIRQVLDRLVRNSELTEAYGPFRLAVDRVFSMKGFGAVVTGTSISGRITVGEEVVVYPRNVSAKIRGIQVHGKDVQMVEAGNRTAINVQGLEKTMIERGDILATPGCLQPSYMLDADFNYLSGNSRQLKNRSRVRVHIGTAEIMGRIVILDEEELAPGSRANVQLLLETPVGVWPGDHYVVRSYSPITTIGGGVIWNGVPPKRRRFKEITATIFDLYHNGSPDELALMHLRESRFQGLTPEELAVRIGQFGNRLRKILDGPISARRILIIDSEKQRMIAADLYDGLVRTVLDTLAAYHQEYPMRTGLSKEELRSKLHGGLDQRLFQYLLNGLTKKGLILQDESVIRLTNHQVSLAEDARTIRSEMEEFYLTSGLSTPTVKETIVRFEKYTPKLVREVQDVLVREGLLVKVTEDLYFHRQVLDNLQQEMVATIRKEGEIDAPRFKNLTGLTRKFSIPLLEYFDKIKVTIRVGDKRILRERMG
jgi:selenocysteine-specific elongation factor